MSRVGKQLIEMPQGVEAKVEDNTLVVKGPKGELKQELHPLVKFEIKDNILTTKVENEKNKSQRALWGLFASLAKNMVIGVTEGFTKKLEINGVGYKAAVSGKKLILNVGYSHPVEYDIIDGVDITVEGNVVTISGIDKQLIGETAAQIRKVRKPEPYKGKGIKYSDEQILRKAGKTAASAGK
jgi:large subunit ribosomal protein L6